MPGVMQLHFGRAAERSGALADGARRERTRREPGIAFVPDLDGEAIAAAIELDECMLRRRMAVDVAKRLAHDLVGLGRHPIAQLHGRGPYQLHLHAVEAAIPSERPAQARDQWPAR